MASTLGQTTKFTVFGVLVRSTLKNTPTVPPPPPLHSALPHKNHKYQTVRTVPRVIILRFDAMVPHEIFSLKGHMKER